MIHEAIARLADGDRSALPLLVTEIWPILRDFARRAVEQEQDAEDVAQEVLMRICFRIADFDRTRDGLSWAFGIASYEILSYRRRKVRRREKLGAPELARLPDPDRSQEEGVMLRDLEGALVRVLGQLSDADRANLGLVDAPQDVAAAALRKRRQRALDRLRTAWRKLYGEP